MSVHAMQDLGRSTKIGFCSSQVVRPFLICVMAVAVAGLRSSLLAAQSEQTLLFAKAVSHWSFQPPRDPLIPVVKDTDWPINAVDLFILARLEEAKLSPAPPMDKRNLIRRATYDLTGLPPSAAEMDSFLNDNAPDAFARVVDRLLASSQYGERWGRHWLDVSRYADTTGPRLGRIPFSYTYRDWVIRAFNDDVPYDAFLVKQLAADKLPNSSDLAALGFLTFGRRSNRDTIHDVIDDWIDVVCRGTMGLSVSCARCHDHKYDPISTEDYYALYGVFQNCQPCQNLPLIDGTTKTDLDRLYEKELGIQQKALIDYKKRRVAEISEELRKPARIAAYLLATRGLRPERSASDGTKTDEEEINPFVLRRWRLLLAKLAEQGDPYWKPWFEMETLPQESSSAQATTLAERYARELAAADSPKAHADPQKEALRRVLRGSSAPPDIAVADFAEVQNSGPDQGNTENLIMLMNALGARCADAGGQPRAMAVEDASVLRAAHVFVRGNPSNLGVEVPRRFLTVLDRTSAKPFVDGSGRLELARKIASAENPLTARVIVNRIWQHHFGAGLVRTPSDFGARGDPPTHPELLDYLARRFVAEGWSIKKLHRLLMLSATYQQSSVDDPAFRNVDPENRLLWHMNRQRLDFESFRDTVLLVAGQLDLAAYGPPVPLFAQPSMHRRTIYGLIDRAQLPVALRAFDFANPEQHAPQRDYTTVPQQTLFMMNDPFMAEQARNLIGRPAVANEHGAAKRVEILYQLIFGRSPTKNEVSRAVRFIEEAEHENSGRGSTVKVSGWQFGFGKCDDASGNLDSFHPFRVFVAPNQQMALLTTTFPLFAEVWQVSNTLPDPIAGFANLTSSGGEPGGLDYAVVRRWTASQDGVVHISGNVDHKVARELSDGVRARIISSRSGQLGRWLVAKTSVEATVKDIQVKAGDTIDFVVDCGATDHGDEFTWAPVIRLVGKDKSEVVFDSAKSFRGPNPQKLLPWEQLALVMLQSNEFVFVD